MSHRGGLGRGGGGCVARHLAVDPEHEPRSLLRGHATPVLVDAEHVGDRATRHLLRDVRDDVPDWSAFFFGAADSDSSPFFVPSFVSAADVCA